MVDARNVVSSLAFEPSVKRVERNRLPRSLVRLYDTYRTRATEPRAAFAYDTFTEWRDGMSRMLDIVRPSLLRLAESDAALAAQENEFIEKAQVNWRYRGLNSLVIDDPMSVSCINPAQAMGLRAQFETLRNEQLAWLDGVSDDNLSSIVARAPVRMDRGKGAPYWVPSTDHQGAIALRRLAQQWYNLDGLVGSLGSLTKHRPPVLAQTSYMRIQGSRDGKPKVRRIAAIGFVFNHNWVPYAETLRASMKSEHTGDPRDTLREARLWRHAYSLDLKSFDTTVAYETLRLLSDIVIMPFVTQLYHRMHRVAKSIAMTLPSPSFMRSLDEAIITMDVLAPSVDNRYAADLIEALGQIHSGENPTSYKGTRIRRCHCRAKMQYLGYEWGRDAITHNYGDDTILFCNDSRVAEDWFNSPDYLGLREVAAPDATFLMRRIPNGHSYLGRMLASTINREPRMEPEHALRCACSIAVRYHLLRGHPLQHLYLPALRAYGGPRRFQDAVRIASGLQDLSSAADFVAQVSRSCDLMPGSPRVDGAADIYSSVNQLVHNPYLKPDEREMIAAAAIDRDSSAHVDSRKYMSWTDLDSAARSLTFDAAAHYLARYTDDKAYSY